MTTRRGPARELLVANHTFPGPYVIKAFGPGIDGFRADVRAAVGAVVTRERQSLSERKTRSGAKICITVEINADTADEVVAVYDRLYRLEALELIF